MLIELTRGKHAIIDVNDADLVGRSWHVVPGPRSVGNYTFYAARRKGNKLKKEVKAAPCSQAAS